MEIRSDGVLVQTISSSLVGPAITTPNATRPEGKPPEQKQ
jgi:hypothetical protein